MLRVCTSLACALVMALGPLVPGEASAGTPAPIIVARVDAANARVRVEIAEGMTTPCDATTNRMLFAGTMGAGAVWSGTTSAECICVRSTSAKFPNTDWSPSGLACRPRICRGRICRPDPDATIRVAFDAQR